MIYSYMYIYLLAASHSAYIISIVISLQQLDNAQKHVHQKKYSHSINHLLVEYIHVKQLQTERGRGRKIRTGLSKVHALTLRFPAIQILWEVQAWEICFCLGDLQIS